MPKGIPKESTRNFKRNLAWLMGLIRKQSVHGNMKVEKENKNTKQKTSCVRIMIVNIKLYVFD